ncbi:hypothetical protein [Actinomadura oligospora]|uniref:hypothetical protein n=1 Tax=Actinomadura oligospora TaxID=111804 RepID=UPI00047C16A4|nr:hypothetical protein [Actinomadura oligospora]
MKPASIILAAGLAAGSPAVSAVAASSALAASSGGGVAVRSASYECTALSTPFNEPDKTVGRHCAALEGSPTSGRHEGRVRIAVPTLGAADCSSYDLHDYPEQITATRCTYEVSI